MTDPHILERKPYSDSVVELKMSDGTTFFGCSWPDCHFTAPSVSSIGSHYKTHSGKAAQRRRAARRPKSTASTSSIETKALALVDMAQAMLDEIDAWEAEHESYRAKAQKWDNLRKSLDEQ